MASANHILDSLGGTSAVAFAIGVGPSVVHGWRKSNSIPHWRRAALLELAARKDVSLSTTDFPTKDERTPSATKAA